MICSNNSPGAGSEMERHRTANYGNDFDDYVAKVCPMCGAIDPEDFYFSNDECIGCCECIKKVSYDDYGA